MKFIQHHAKAELNRCRDELILGYLLAIEAATGAEKLAFGDVICLGPAQDGDTDAG